jgi:hypothetical protein
MKGNVGSDDFFVDDEASFALSAFWYRREHSAVCEFARHLSDAGDPGKIRY